VDGLVKVDLEVRRREPVTGKEDGEAGSEEQAAPSVAAGKASPKGGKGGR
jgi:hypothetical protein